MNTGNTIYWHDYETFGSDPRVDRPCQFAGLRTDEDLNIVDDPLVIYCRPSLDVIPDPEACMVTGITPQEALEKGVTEAEFCARIADELARPGTCAAGYNSIRFDDEVTRHLLYRCFHDPYEREWKNGNSRWDVIDLVRLTHALRPEGINWPQNDDGNPSFRLEDLTRVNGIAHEGAHDALADVRATIGIARLIREKQPRLYDYYYTRRFKSRVLEMIDLGDPRPLVHVSAMYPAADGCMAIVLPLAAHPENANGIIVYDLGMDPEKWLSLPVEDIRERLFATRDELEEKGLERVALKTVHVNKCPALAPLNVLTDDVLARYGIDLQRCERHRRMLMDDERVRPKIAAAFELPEGRREQSGDPDRMLYSGGFFSDADRRVMAELRQADAGQLPAFADRFRDPRLPEMLFRYRCRNFPETLTGEEEQRWLAYCRDRLTEAVDGGDSHADRIRQRIETLAATAEGTRRIVLDKVSEYIDSVADRVGAKR